ncbi:MAG: anthranilate phosphoribosyltransferase [Limnochordaceae bacterium]|nr:anthranilate phosphoribosyltransferase [Limnochordaceae bacterium]
MIREAIAQVTSGQALTQEEAAAAMTDIMEGRATPAQVAAWITALRLRGETVPEIAGAAIAMRAAAHRITPRVARLVDTCGTGGDGAHTFNISTAAAIVVAGAGVPVAKHGNRAVSSQAGSADVLEALGVEVLLSPASVQQCIETIGIGFLFAQVFHPAMRFAAGPRREIGIRTIFNVLGPLTNPAAAPTQLVGVYSAELVQPVAEVLDRLGCERALVVHGLEDGVDEISLSGPTLAAFLDHHRVTIRTLTPQDLGLTAQPPQAVRGESAQENAQRIRRLLAGEKGPARDVVLLNAAGALWAAGVAGDLSQGVRLAAESIDSGAAARRLEEWVMFTRAAKQAELRQAAQAGDSPETVEQVRGVAG